MKGIQHIYVPLPIRDHDPAWSDVNELPMGHSEFFTIRRPESERNKTTTQSFADVFNRSRRTDLEILLVQIWVEHIVNQEQPELVKLIGQYGCPKAGGCVEVCAGEEDVSRIGLSPNPVESKI